MANRNIIMKHASMWPREVCDLRDKDGKKLFIKNYFREPGVYVLYRDEHPYYIGKASCLGVRIWAHSNHPHDRYYHFWNMFSAFVVKDRKYLDEVEGILIAAMPSGNSARPRIPDVRLPAHIVQQLRRLRQHEANPITRREFERAIKSLRSMPRD